MDDAISKLAFISENGEPEDVLVATDICTNARERAEEARFHFHEYRREHGC
ncbi:hypothetical protein ACPOL_3436 [Acidisarcina polymorpha]|uniref:Uncharacterized protein n=1 Tax=Acidisarcina polymorpha TaxID=2211140 RepID=A0A2Z5G0M8_9BACT|nr:hypothetical protein ACPOL_3436 [Acidisarcina polymorpha]